MRVASNDSKLVKEHESESMRGLVTIASDDLQFGILLLDVLDHLDLVNGIALRRVQNDDIDTVGHQQMQTCLILVACTNGSAHKQLFIRILGGIRIGSCLLQIGTCYHGNEFSILIHNGQLALLALLQYGIRHGQCDAIGRCCQLCRHYVRQQDIGLILTEINVTRRDHAQQFATQLTVLGDRITGEAVLATSLEHIANGIGWRHNRRIPHKAMFVFLNLVHLQRLILRRAVVMDDPNATTQLRVGRRLERRSFYFILFIFFFFWK